MIRPNVNLEKYQYKISDVELSNTDNNEVVTISSELVRSLAISNDYENNVTSSYMMTLLLNKSDYEKIVVNIDKLNANFKLTRSFVGFIDDTDDVDRYEKTRTYQDYEYASLSLRTINESNLNTVDANKMNSKTTDNLPNNTEDNGDYTQDLIPLTLYMYDANNLNKYKINKSFIIQGGINDCIYQLFKDRNFNNLLVDGSANASGTYAVPYGNLGFNLKKLNEYYGIYDKPYLFFMDINRNYLINKGNLGRCLAKGEIGNVNIYLEKLEDQSSVNETGCYLDEENKMYILNSGAFEIMDNDSSIDYVAGGKITTVVRGTGSVTHDQIGTSNVESTYVVNNDKQRSQLLYNIKESKRVVGLIFSNIDLSIFTPNKAFNIIPDESYYSNDYNIKGKYRLSSSNIYISKQSEGIFKSNIQITLNKVE